MQPLASNAAEASLEVKPPLPNRRRAPRHRIHTPAYVNFDGAVSSLALDLSEIIDISEAGMAIQTSSPLETDKELTLSLDLSETGTRIPVGGKVVWWQPSGRAGIRFLEVAESSRRFLNEWLLANALTACTNATAPEKEIESVPPEPQGLDLLGLFSDDLRPAQADYTSVLTALAAVKREVEALGSDLPAALQLIVTRAQAFTRASGAAIALTDGQEVTCRAVAGSDVPGLGAIVPAGSGFSGECVRTGQLQRCMDTETDPRVDPEACRWLGIRSMVAVPIHSDHGVAGLLEVFARVPDAFSVEDDVVLPRLADFVSAAMRRSESDAADQQPAAVAVVDDEFPVQTPADLPIPRISQSRNFLLIGAAITVLLVIVWVLGPWDANHGASWSSLPAVEQRKLSSEAPQGTRLAVSSLDGLRRLAEQGDSVAQFAVGTHYATGEDVPQDYAEAVRWFSRAAEQGNVMAQTTLGTYFWAGRGVTADPAKAYFWWLVAEGGGDASLKDQMALVSSRLSHNQLSAVQQEANDWIRSHKPATPNPAGAP